MRREDYAAHRVGVPEKGRHWHVGVPNVPDADGLVHRPCGHHEVVILVPVERQDFEVVGPERAGAVRQAQVPELHRAVARGGGEDVPLDGAPGSLVDAIRVLRESSH